MANKKIILCVDDEITILNSLKAELKTIFDNNFLIEVAQSGVEALELTDEVLADNQEIILVISDYLMPNMTGDEFLGKLHLKSPETINILLTGQATLDGVANAIAHAKLYRYMSKPWQRDDFRLTVTEAVNRYVRDQDLRKKNEVLEKLTLDQSELIKKLQHNEAYMRQLNQDLEHALKNEIKMSNLARQQEEANRKLADLSYTDSLTGIANRRQFDDFIHNEWERARILNMPVSLGMIDVDWFKKYNDFYGHQAGDECLHLVAQTLKSTVRHDIDLIARYGGEEFIFVCPGSSAKAVLNTAQHICKMIESLAIKHELSVFNRVTASLGVSTLVPDADTSFKLLIKLADDALYTAKEKGRNQVSVSGDFSAQ